jgi:hypothetical protein
MFFLKLLSKVLPQETLTGGADIPVCLRDNRKIRQLSRRPRQANNYRPLLEELEPIIVMSSVLWTGASGDWSSAASWTDSGDGSHHVPGPTDVAVINTAVTVTHSANLDFVQSLTLGAASVVSNLTLSGGTLTVSGAVQNQGLGAFTLANGTLADATVASGTTLQVAPGTNSSTLSGVTLNSSLTVPGNTTLNVANNLALNGATLTDSGTLNFNGITQSVTTSGTAAISGGGTVRANTSGSTITFATGVTLSGGLSVNGVSGVTWIFQGTVSAGVGQTVSLSATGDAFINQGAWQSTSGGTLTLGGIWTNNGAITVSGATSTLNLGGNFTTAGIGTLNHTSGAVNITGSLDNAGSTLALNNTTGTWSLVNGAINGGIITTAGSAVLNVGPNGNSLSGVTLNGTAIVANTATLNITNGLALNGGTLSVNGTLNFSGGGAQSVTTTGTAALSGGGTIRANTPGSTITFGNGVTLSGGLTVGGFGSTSGMTWIFQGTVSAGFGQTLTLSVNGDAAINQGAWQSVSGGTLDVEGNWTNNGAITVTGTNSTLILGGNFTTADVGTLNHTNGAINIAGSLDNSGNNLALNDSTGAWNLSTGTISGGIISTAGRALLNITLNGTLSGVTLAGTVTLGGSLNIANNLALDDATLTGNGTLNFRGGTQSVTGTGVIRGSGTIQAEIGGSTITFASGVTLSGGFTIGGTDDHLAFTWIFQGTVSVDFGQALTFYARPDAYINEGTLESISGGTLNLGGHWTNHGTITVSGPSSTLNLGGVFTTAGIGTLNNTNGRINIAGSLDNSGNTLALNDNTGTWNLISNATIIGGSITTAGSAFLNTVFQTDGTLRGVTLAGRMVLNAYGRLNITNGLALDGATLTVNGALNFSGGTQSVTGAGAISGGGLVEADTDGSTITLGSGVALSGDLIVGGPVGASGVTWIFQGAASAGFGQTLTLAGSAVYINQGAWQAIGGGTLTLENHWTNNGTITVSGTNSTLNLESNFTTADIGRVNHTSGAINIAGFLDNAGNTLALDDTTGTWNVTQSATISGGVITTAGSAVLHIAQNSDSTLNGVTLSGTIALATNTLFITNGLTLNGGTLTDDPDVVFNAFLVFRGGSQSVTGAGTITGRRGIQADTPGSTITFASGVTLSGGLGFGAADVTWIFQGIVSAGLNQTINLSNNGNAYINQGTWQSISGGTLHLGGNWTNHGTITVSGTNSALNLDGNFTTADIGTVNHTSGAVNITGSLNNAGNTLALNNTTGTWNLFNGTISGGIITTTGSAVLNIISIANTLSGVTLNGTVTLPQSTTLKITNGVALNDATLSANGTLNFSGVTPSITGTGAINGGGNIQADTAGATITFASGVTLSGALKIGGGSGTHTWIFQGAVSASVSGQTLAFTSSDAFTNQGTFEARNGGTLSLPTGPTYTNYSGTRLTGGAWQVFGGSKMILVGSGIATDAADILLDGSGSNIYRSAAAMLDALAGLTSVTRGNSLALKDGASLTTTGTVTNAGTVSIGASSGLGVGASYLQTEGTTTLDGTLTAPTLADVLGGTLSGTGTLIGDLQNEASILIGTATTAGTLTVTGAYTQSASGNLTIKVGGPNPGVDFDQFVVGGVATLDGALTIRLFNGFVPDSGTTYQVLTFASATGTFATLEGDGPLFTAGYDSMDLTLTAI